MELHIYIPTRGRETKQVTYDQMPIGIRNNTYLVVPLTEVLRYQIANAGAHVLGCPVQGIAPTRDWILEHAKLNGHQYVMMLDDDLTIQRRDPADGKIKTVTPVEYEQAVKWIEDRLREGYVHAGWGVRFLAWNAPVSQAHMSPGRMMYSLAYDVSKINGSRFTNGLEWNSTMEDFNMTLQLLQGGKNNIVSLEWRANPRQTNAVGGCSTWRTAELASQSAEKLKKMFPTIVALRDKKAWEGMDAPTIKDVTIQWKKAFRRR
jgi:hypothetical protein